VPSKGVMGKGEGGVGTGLLISAYRTYLHLSNNLSRLEALRVGGTLDLRDKLDTLLSQSTVSTIHHEGKSVAW